MVVATITKRKRTLAVKIAKDVLKRLRWLAVTPGTYLDIPFSTISKIGSEADAKKNLTKIQKRCRVCALGACMLSWVAIKDKMTVKELDDISVEDIFTSLQDAFTRKNLGEIEAAFEGFGGSIWIIDSANYFYNTYPNAKKRLQAIMLSIIENKGEFKPERSS